MIFYPQLFEMSYKPMIKVLIVDDCEDVLDADKMYLSKYFQIVTASNLRDALIVTKNESIDVLVTDKNIWGHRGVLPLLDYMQHEKPYVPVIIHSGEDGYRARKELYCHAFLEKWGRGGDIQDLHRKILELTARW